MSRANQNSRLHEWPRESATGVDSANDKLRGTYMVYNSSKVAIRSFEIAFGYEYDGSFEVQRSDITRLCVGMRHGKPADIIATSRFYFLDTRAGGGQPRCSMMRTYSLMLSARIKDQSPVLTAHRTTGPQGSLNPVVLHGWSEASQPSSN